MTTAALRIKIDETLARLDKACGKSFIAESKECSKQPSVANKNLTAKKLLTAGGVLATGVVLGALAKSTHEVLTSKLPDDAVPHPQPPEGLYDSFQPGDLIYQAVDFAGTQRAHYSVYVGKVNGEHRIFDVSTKKSSSGKVTGSVASMRTMDEAHLSGSSFRAATRVDKSGDRPSSEALNKIIDQLNGKDFDWTGFKTNCETFARAIVNDLPVSTQSKNVSPLTSEIVASLIKATLPKRSKQNVVKQQEVAEIVKKTITQDAAMSPKSQAEQILRPIFNSRPLSVMSVSLSPEGVPIGVFRGEPRPGQTHYYTFRMGQTVQFKRVMAKKDAMDEGCGCEECDKQKRRKGEAFEKVDSDLCWKGYEQVGTKRKGKRSVPNCVPKEDAMDSVNLSSLERKEGKVYYQGRWWKPNEPVPSTAKGKKKMVLAVKDGKVKIVHFGAEGYGHNYSEEARKSYLARSAGIKGTDDQHSANYWARKVLWAGKGGSVAKPKGDARLDKKCGASGIPDNKQCHSEGVMSAIGMGAAAINSGVFEKAITARHGVSPKEAREFSRSLQMVLSKGGEQKAKEHYKAWAKNTRDQARRITVDSIKARLDALAIA